MKTKGKVKAILKLCLSLKQHTFTDIASLSHGTFCLRSFTGAALYFTDRKTEEQEVAARPGLKHSVGLLGPASRSVHSAPQAPSLADFLKFRFGRSANTPYCLGAERTTSCVGVTRDPCDKCRFLPLPQEHSAGERLGGGPGPGVPNARPQVTPKQPSILESGSPETGPPFCDETVQWRPHPVAAAFTQRAPAPSRQHSCSHA